MSSKVLEIEEKTIDGAIEKACREFGVPREKLNIEIISEGSNGFLGLMAKKAKIRASLSVLSFEMDFALNTPPSVKAELKKETKSDDRPRHESRHESKHEAKQEKSDVKHDRPDTKHESRHDSKHENRHEVKRHEKTETRAEGKTDIKHESRHDNRPKPEHRSIKPASHPPRQHVPRTAPPVETKPADAPEAETLKPTAPVVPPVEAVEASSPAAFKARDLLAGMLNQMTFNCQVKALETDDTIILNISGDESGLLIGRRGQNLDALQYILNKAINRSEADRKMIIVDSEDYRQRRRESLISMAERIRDKVKKTQKPLSLAHMNAHDRRIIHLALQEDETLVTKSRGEGEFRKVIVLPAKKSGSGGHSKPRTRQQQEKSS